MQFSTFSNARKFAYNKSNFDHRRILGSNHKILKSYLSLLDNNFENKSCLFDDLRPNKITQKSLACFVHEIGSQCGLRKHKNLSNQDIKNKENILMPN